jgi:Domain of unknown function (DUF4279)
METRAAFRLQGDAGLTAATVTRRLGLQPTSSHEAGDPVSSRSAGVRDSSLWVLSSSPRIEGQTEIAGQLDRLLAALEPVAGLLSDLVASGYTANWYCWIASHATERAGPGGERPPAPAAPAGP